MNLVNELPLLLLHLWKFCQPLKKTRYSVTCSYIYIYIYLFIIIIKGGFV